MTRTLDRHDPRRNDALGLVRRQVAAGNYTEKDVEGWKAFLGDDDVQDILDKLAPKKARKRTPKPASPAEPEKE